MATHTRHTHQCWDHELLPLHHKGFLQTVSAHSTPLPQALLLKPMASSHALLSFGYPGRCMRLVLVPWQCHHIHPGNHRAHGKAIHVFWMCQNSWLYCTACYNDKKGVIWKQIWNIELQRINQHVSVAGLICQRGGLIFQCGCDVAALTGRILLEFGNPKGFWQQNLSWTSY